jgi:hypothetical protein
MPKGIIPSLVTSSVSADHQLSIDDTVSESPTKFSCDKCGALANFSPDTGHVWGPAVDGVCTS